MPLGSFVDRRIPLTILLDIGMLQTLCKAIMLRRTKKSTFEGKPILILPDRTTEIENPEFSEDEMKFYHALENRTQLQFNK